jgi:DNA repair protein RecN (Recombination protein N)
VLHHLHIKNFAIVEQLELHFHTGLTIISGETGAGKSILIDALSLVLGERADSHVVRQSCESAQVDATFSLPPLTRDWLQQQGITQDDTCLVQRVIYRNGRSRGYINDQPVPIQILRQLGEQLIDIHGQHAHQSLLRHEAQRQLLDDRIEDRYFPQQIIWAYQRWKSVQTALEELGGQNHDAKLALLRYQVQELEPFELTSETISHLEAEHRRLANINKLLENSQRALTLLDAEEDNSALSYLVQANRPSVKYNTTIKT